MGRPTSFTRPIAKKIADLVKSGSSRRNAAIRSDVDYATVKRWYARGKAGEEPFVEFFHALKKADAEWEDGQVARLMSGEKPLGAQFLLERDSRTRARWGTRNRFEDADRETAHDFADLTDDEAETLERILRKKRTA